MKGLQSIQQAPVLEGLSEAGLARCASIAQEVDLLHGDRLFTRGEKAEGLYIARSGRFALTIALRVFDLTDEMAVEEKVPLDAFGWSALVLPHRSIYSCYCTQDGSVVMFPAEELRLLMESDEHLGQQLGANLNELMGDRIRVLQQLWVDEVELHMDRANYWTQTELSRSLIAASKPPAVDGAARQWLERQTHRHKEG